MRTRLLLVMLLDAAAVLASDSSHLRPSGKGDRPVRLGEQPIAARIVREPLSPAESTMSYHGGPLMTAGINVYLIWYGNWSDNSATSLLPQLAASIGGSSYFNAVGTYYDAGGVHVANAVAYRGSTYDHYSRGSSLSDADVPAIVERAIRHKLPADGKGVYFVLTSADVDETSGFCSEYCGWHSKTTIRGTDVKYAFIGNGARCFSACVLQTRSPNNNPGADAMASVLAHELAEAATDPDLNGWYDARGQESSDLCAWSFGAVYATPNGASANVRLGGVDYLLQQNWVNADGGYCGPALSNR